MHVVSVCLHYGNIIWLPWQRPLTNWKIRYRSIICTYSAFICVKIAKIGPVDRDIRPNTPVFGRVVPDVYKWALSTLELAYWTEFHEIFTRYTDIICAVNALIEVAISHSVSECQSDKNGEFAIFFTKSVAMAMSFETSKKEVQIDHLHPKHFHSVKRLRKLVQRIPNNLYRRNH